MIITVQGFAQIHSKKTDKDYTIVHVLTDIPAENGGNCVDKLIIEGKRTFKIGAIYEPLYRERLDNGRVIHSVYDLVEVK